MFWLLHARARWRRRIGLATVLFLALAGSAVRQQSSADAATTPTGFTDTTVWSGLDQPTAIAFAVPGPNEYSRTSTSGFSAIVVQPCTLVVMGILRAESYHECSRVSARGARPVQMLGAPPMCRQPRLSRYELRYSNGVTPLQRRARRTPAWLPGKSRGSRHVFRLGVFQVAPSASG